MGQLPPEERRRREAQIAPDRRRTPGVLARLARVLTSPLALLLELVAAVSVMLLAAIILLQGRDVPVPAALADMIERRIETALSTEIELGQISLTAAGYGWLRLAAEDVRLIGPDGAARVSLPRVSAALGPGALVPPVSAPADLLIEGAALSIVRQADGTLDIGSEVLERIFRRTPPRTPAEAAERVQALLGRQVMQTLDRLTLEGLSLTLQDSRSGRDWQIEDAQLSVRRSAEAITVSLALNAPGRVVLRATFPAEGPPEVQLSALLDDVPAADLAAQVPALVWLAPLQATVSGALITSSGADGALGRLDGTLEIGAGRLAPREGGAVPFDRAQAYFTYRPDEARLQFSQFLLEAPNARLEGDGHADLISRPGALPHAMTAQLAVQTAQFDAGPALEHPVTLNAGWIDARVQFAPFAIDIGQIVLTADPGVPQREESPVPAALADPAPDIRLSGRGRIEARDGGFPAVFDLALSEIAPDRVLSLWPIGAVPRTREWLVRNLLGGRLLGMRAHVRLVPGERPVIAFSFRFREALVRVLRGLPPIEDGAGFASLADHRFSLTVEAGGVEPPLGGRLDLANSVFTIENTRKRPGDAVVQWRSAGTLTSVLSLIDQPPLSLLSRTGRSAEIADAEATLDGVLTFPVKKGLQLSNVKYKFNGELADVTSEVLVPGRLLSSEDLTVTVAPEGLDLAGSVALDGVLLDLRFTRPFGPEGRPAEASGTVLLSADATEALGITLPPGTLSGEGAAEFELVLPEGGRPDLTLRSDLRGLGLRLAPLGWSKPAATGGAFALTARLGGPEEPPVVEDLSLSAPGFDAEGSLTLRPAGGLDRLSLDRLRVGSWLDVRGALVGRGAGRTPNVALNGGRLDLREAALGQGGGGQGAGAISGRLDRLTLTEGIAMTDLQLDLDGGAALTGEISGRVNGGAAVNGTLSAGRNGRPALSLRARDAGGVLAAAGAFQEAQGGTLALNLTPQAETGRWRGDLSVDDIRVTAAPGLAALLNAISVVGILDQLNGPGLAFSTIRAQFRLTPGGVEVTSASAVGPSLGVSAEGFYDPASNRVDLRGVLSPIYFINAIGQVFSREGEGLFGMNYTVQGSASNPEIRVNPLSMLTPGAFREIFRTVPPSPGTAAQ